MINARLPYDQSLGAVVVTHGVGGAVSHTGVLTTSWDFGVPFGTEVFVMPDT